MLICGMPYVEHHNESRQCVISTTGDIWCDLQIVLGGKRLHTIVSVDNGILKGFWRKIGISDISKNSESSWTSINLNTQENRGEKIGQIHLSISIIHQLSRSNFWSFERPGRFFSSTGNIKKLASAHSCISLGQPISQRPERPDNTPYVWQHRSLLVSTNRFEGYWQDRYRPSYGLVRHLKDRCMKYCPLIVPHLPGWSSPIRRSWNTFCQETLFDIASRPLLL